MSQNKMLIIDSVPILCNMVKPWKSI